MNKAKVIILRKKTQIVQSDRANTHRKFAVTNKKVILLKWQIIFLIYFSGILHKPSYMLTQKLKMLLLRSCTTQNR